MYTGWTCIESRNKIMKRHVSTLPSLQYIHRQPRWFTPDICILEHCLYTMEIFNIYVPVMKLVSLLVFHLQFEQSSAIQRRIWLFFLGMPLARDEIDLTIAHLEGGGGQGLVLGRRSLSSPGLSEHQEWGVVVRVQHRDVAQLGGTFTF